MMQGKTILLLGGSKQQVPAIEKAKALGLRTILIDYLSDNPGKEVADKWYQESTTDIEAVFRIAKDEGVDGILAYASDPAALPAAIVCEKLGLPTNPVKAVEILGVKHKFREFLQRNGFPCPKNFTFHPSINIDELLEKLKSLTYPIVIKPTDSSGSKGVTFLRDNNDLLKAVSHADSYSRNKILIAEEFIVRGYPYVIGGDVFVEDGLITLYGDMECLRDDNGESLIPIGEKYPNGLSKFQKKRLYSELQRLISTLDIRNGELNIELLIDKNDQPHFLEVGPRAGGNMIPIQLSDAYCIDLIEANIRASIGEMVRISTKMPNECIMTYVLHSHVAGIFKDIVFSPEIEPYIYRKVIYKNPGDIVEAFDGAGKALGIVFMKFPGTDEMNGIEQNIDKLVRVRLKTI